MVLQKRYLSVAKNRLALLMLCLFVAIGNLTAQTITYPSGYPGLAVGTSDSRLVASVEETETTVTFNIILVGEALAESVEFNVFFDPAVLKLTDNTFSQDLSNVLGYSNTYPVLLDAVEIVPDLQGKGWFTGVVYHKETGTGGDDHSYHTKMRAVVVRVGGVSALEALAGEIKPVFTVSFNKTTSGKALETTDIGFGIKTTITGGRYTPKWTYRNSIAYVNDGAGSFVAPDLFAYRSPSSVSTDDIELTSSTSALLYGSFVRGDIAPANNLVDNIGSATTGNGRLNWDAVAISGFIYSDADVDIYIKEFTNTMYIDGVAYPFPSDAEIAAGSFTRGTNTFYIKTSTANTATDPSQAVAYTVPVDDLTEGTTYYAWAFIKYIFETSNPYPLIADKIEFTLEGLCIVSDTLNISICQNDFYDFNGQLLNITGTYSDTLALDNGCDSIVVLHLTMNPVDTLILYDTICINESYAENGFTIPVQLSPGVVNDTLFLNNQFGCDSIVILELQVICQPTYNTLYADICANGYYPFDGQNLNTAGIYHDTIPLINGCDSIVTLHLTVNPTDKKILYDTIYINESYTENGFTIPVQLSPGVVNDTLFLNNQFGCDSTVVLELQVNCVSAYNTLYASICADDYYPFDGQNLNTAGIYHDTIPLINGCDSIVTLHLALNPVDKKILYDTIYINESYTENGFTIPVQLSPGVVNDTLFLNNQFGCDSTVILKLKVNCLPKYNTLYVSICAGDSYPFDGKNLNTTGTYYDTIPLANGCDSIVTLHLTVKPTDKKILYDKIPVNEPYSKNGFTIPAQTSPGLVLDTLFFTNTYGCDSILILSLNVLCFNHLQLNEVICQNDRYDFNGQYITKPGTYYDTVPKSAGCYDAVILHLNVLPASPVIYVTDTIFNGENYDFNGQLYWQAGTYMQTFTNRFGCDSTVILYLETYSCPEIEIPSFFTPNYNGLNDVWKIANIECYKHTVYLYDRFGKLLHCWKNDFTGWDGTYLGKPMPSTDYWYLVDLSRGKEYVGHFTLLRR